MNGMMAGMGLWMLLVVVTVVAVLVAAVLASVWLARRLRADRATGGHTADGSAGETRLADDSGAHEVLQRRYAAGEIDDEEYERRLAALTRR